MIVHPPTNRKTSMDVWTYVLTRLSENEPPRRCEEAKCSVERSPYRLIGTSGKSSGGKNYCLQHTAAACCRLGVKFPMGKK